MQFLTFCIAWSINEFLLLILQHRQLRIYHTTAQNIQLSDYSSMMELILFLHKGVQSACAWVYACVK
jgi:hypothetical protein